MSKKYTGRCACGAITFAFDQTPEFVANCHCLDCKKASGGEMATFFGKGLDRNFCPECGARLFTTNLETFPGLVFVALGSLDRPELIGPKIEMFTKRRLAWNKPLDIPQFTGMPN